jgi:flagellar biogenesis protein FliO
MLSHTGSLWHYLGSFILYTLLAIGAIYGAYWYARRATGSLIPGLPNRKPVEEDPLKLTIESTLALEPRKTLYVIRSGEERFLIAASGETTQILSKLESPKQPEPEPEVISLPMERPVERPWYAEAPKPVIVPRKTGFGTRFVQSVQWLVSSRSKLT